MATTFDKPAGLTVFPPHWDARGDCVLRRLLEEQPWRAAVAWPRGFEGGIAHRLDNATSGALVVADSLDELAQLRAWFAGHQLVKIYLMLAAREVAWNRRDCARAIAHHRTRKNRMVVQESPTTPHRGKWYPARSEFRRVQGRLWEVRMSSGVMHQIRAHAAFLGIPLLGDRIYGGGAAPQMLFHLHHVGLHGPEGFATRPVSVPEWARAAAPAAPTPDALDADPERRQ